MPIISPRTNFKAIAAGYCFKIVKWPVPINKSRLNMPYVIKVLFPKNYK